MFTSCFNNEFISIFILRYTCIFFYDERCKKNFPVRDNKVILYCIVLYCIVLYCIVLYCIVLYCIVLSLIGLIQSQQLRRVNEDLRTREITSNCAELMLIIMYFSQRKKGRCNEIVMVSIHNTLR